MAHLKKKKLESNRGSQLSKKTSLLNTHATAIACIFKYLYNQQNRGLNRINFGHSRPLVSLISSFQQKTVNKCSV